jgi:DNA-binding transcriptional LysR family regulator
MHIETLKIFCDLADLESFSLAAERNFITQSAVSQQIRGLEEKYKRRLIERVRGRRDVKLTSAGEVFYHESKRVLSAYDKLEENLRGVVGKIGGTIKVSTIYSIGLHELPQKVREFMTKFPSAKIDLEYSRTTRVVRDVQSGAVDLGVLAFPEPKKGLTITKMPDDKMVLITPPDHKFATRKKVKVTDLEGQDFVHFERDVPTRKAMDRIFKANHVDVNKVAEFDNIETIKRAVEVGFGIAIVPETSVSVARELGTLAVVPLAEKYWVRSVGVIHRSDRSLSLATRKFIELLAK